MKAVLALVAVATLLTFVGGIGWVACRIAEADPARIVFQWMLVVAIAVTFAALGVALIVGVYHLYLYWFTDKRPLSLFATTSKDDK
ncbi:MAG TPA: hypothetical protein VFF06_35765 [Polyangia bacterium]|nr:hypothetical protein [Polyangia bacterium]